MNKELRNLRNKAFPPKLEFGVEVKLVGMMGTDIVKYVSEKNGKMIAMYDDGTVHVFPENPERIGSSHSNLGLPVSWIDILNMYRLRYEKGTENSVAEIMSNGHFLCPSLNIVIDLYKLPEEQDPETIDNLIEILK